MPMVLHMYEGYRVDSTAVSTQKTRKDDYAYLLLRLKVLV
jgi:hypothetical protein